jgi:hypothetical protein
MYVAAGYPDELADFSGLDDRYDMLEYGVRGRVENADIATLDAAQALAERRPRRGVPLKRLFTEDRHPLPEPPDSGGV